MTHEEALTALRNGTKVQGTSKGGKTYVGTLSYYEGDVFTLEFLIDPKASGVMGLLTSSIRLTADNLSGV